MKTNNTLEFNIILELLSNHALSKNTKERLLSLKPFLSERECKLKMLETTEARKILETVGSPPLSSMKELDKILELTTKSSMLIPEQLMSVTEFIYACKRMKIYLRKAEPLDVNVAYYGGSIDALDSLYNEINRCIRNESVDDTASTYLRDVRRKIGITQTAVKTKLETILSSKKAWFSDGNIVIRNGRYALPVKKEYKNQLSGTVLDISKTGGTCFIEPTAVRVLQEKLSLLQIDEDNEIRKILYTLTALVDEHINQFKINKDCMETLDFIFAKAKLSIEMDAIHVNITTQRKIVIVKGRHPLLKKEDCVPLDFQIGDDVTGVVITGANTGGKTVGLKTVGLLSIMAQCGLHVPASEGSVFCMHSNVLCDIGDGQSIAENLSTFSSHIKNIIEILKDISNESLVLLDELGSGTDPTEGMGLAIAILEELRLKNCLFVATTHYPEIKEYAKNTQGLINARMDFDRENLKPLYKLTIGEAGESCAFYIAQRLGLPAHMLNRAQAEAYEKERYKRYNNSEIIPFVETNVLENNGAKVKIKKEVPKNTEPLRSDSFNIGDSVAVSPSKSIGIVCKKSNDKGELVVQIKGEKHVINHKKITLMTPASELYPDDYDFSIIFDTVPNRKARNVMGKRHDPNLTVVYEKEK